MNPNQIIAALLDIASAANSLRYCVAITSSPEHRTILAEDLAKLEEALDKLEPLPHVENMPPLTGSARARYAMASFLAGAPVVVDAAPMLKELAEAQKAIEGMALQPLHGFGIPNDAEVNDITMGVLGKWPSFEAQSWACKVVRAVAEKLRDKDIAAARDKLLADTATEAHKIWNDADLLEQLRRMCGYVENGSSQYVSIGQDDATREWTVSVGIGQRKRHFSAGSFHSALRLAADGEIENETCKFCGFDVEFPCDEAPVDICSAAIRAAEKQKRKAPSLQAMAPAGPTKAEKARDTMNNLLFDLATQYSNATAKKIIRNTGGTDKLKDIPDDRVQAVTIATRDRLAFERRVAELSKAGNITAANELRRRELSVESVVQPVILTIDGKPVGTIEGDPEAIARTVKRRDEVFREIPLSNRTFPLPEPVIVPPREELGQDAVPHHDHNGLLPPVRTDYDTKDGGGTFDGGGASGDYE